MSYEELGVFGRLRKVFPMTFFPMTKWNEILALTERVVGFPLWSGPYVPDISGHLERNLLSCISRWKSTLLKVLQLIPGHIIRILSSLYRWSDSSTSTVWTDTNWLCWLLHTMPKATPQMTTGQSRHMIIQLTRTIHLTVYISVSGSISGNFYTTPLGLGNSEPSTSMLKLFRPLKRSECFKSTSLHNLERTCTGIQRHMIIRKISCH